MKVTNTNPLLSLLVAATLVLPVSAATLYWDGGITDIPATGDGASAGGTGTWNTTILNWDPGIAAHVAWSSANVAVFGGTAGEITVDAGGISAQRLVFTADGYILSGGALALSGGSNTAGGETFNVGSGITATVNDNITTNSGEVWLRGGGKLVLGGINSIVGSLVISGGSTLEISAMAAIGGSSTNLYFNNSGGAGTFRYTGSSSTLSRASAANTLAPSGASTFDVANEATTMTISTGFANNSAPGASSSFAKAGAGTIDLTGNNTFNGGLFVREGTLRIAGASGAIASQTVTLGNGITSGKLVLGDSTNTKSITFSNLTTAGTGSANAVVGGSAANSTLTVNTTTFGNFIGSIGGAGTNENNVDLIKNGTGVLTLSGTSTLTGKVTVNNGLLGIRYGTELGTPATPVADQVTLNGGTLMNMTNASSTTAFGNGWSPTLGANVGVTLGAVGGTIRVGYGGGMTLAINGIISGDGSLTKTDSGVLALGGDNSFTGDTNWSGTGGSYGTIKLTTVNALKNSSVDMTNGTLDLNGLNNVVLGGLKGSGNLTLGSKVLKGGNNDATTNYTGSLSSGTLNKIGSGELTLSGTTDNPFLIAVVDAGTLVLGKTNGGLNPHAVGTTDSAALTINGGTAKLGGSGDQIYTASLVAMTGGTFDLAANSEGFRGLTGTAGVVTNTGGSTSTLTVGEGSLLASSYNFAGNIQGDIALIKTGAGTQILSGTNTYTGATTVNAGALLVNNTTDSGTGSGSVTVNNNGTTLGGSGTLGGPVTLELGAVLSPGVSGVAGLSFNSDLTLEGGSNYIVEVTNFYASDYVSVAAGGTLTLNGTITLTAIGHSFAIGDSYDIADADTITGTPTISPATPGDDLEWDTSDLLTTGEIKVVAAATDAYTNWASSINDPAKRGRMDDADGDGLTNIQEFLFGTSPNENSGSLSTVTQVGGTLVIRWMERVSGASYHLMESATLANDWSPSAVTIEDDGSPSGDYQPRKATITPGDDKNFFRVEGVEN